MTYIATMDLRDGDKGHRFRPPGCPIREAFAASVGERKKDIICIFLSFFNNEINILPSSLAQENWFIYYNGLNQYK